MRIRTQPQTQGGVLVVTLLTAVIIGLALASYLTLVSSQNASTMRSLAWNSALPIVESGVEEALTQLHYTGITNLAANNWTPLGSGLYSKKRELGNHTYFEVTVRAVEPPVIVSSAYVPAPMTPSSQLGMILGGLLPPLPGETTSTQPVRMLKRKVRVNTRRDPFWAKAMVAKGLINLNGNNVTTDSFDSTDPLWSTAGKYDPAKTKDNGDVATNSELVNSLSAGNADIKGHVATGPNGSVDIGSNGSVGSKAWVEGGNNGVQPGYVSDDMNVDIKDVQLPSGSPTSVSSGNFIVGGTNYNYVLNGLAAGERFLKSSSLSGKVYVTGNVAIWVTDSVSFSGQDFIYLAPGASLKLYVGAASANLGGQGVINSGSALNFQYLGLKSNTSLSFSGNGAFTGAIYAPYAAFQLNGGGNSIIDFIGASVTSTVQMNGHFNFHYDEALAKLGPARDYIVTAWNEVEPGKYFED